MITYSLRLLVVLATFAMTSSTLSCLRDLAATKSLEILLSQTLQQQAATLNTLPLDSIDILKTALILKIKPYLHK
ncbi:hypothetical protein H0X48_00060 [Candidatus Dependentiae bacterium]|nr:hypothetical protein [Candidatus Dependentiae bacterium]